MTPKEKGGQNGVLYTHRFGMQTSVSFCFDRILHVKLLVEHDSGRLDVVKMYRSRDI